MSLHNLNFCRILSLMSSEPHSTPIIIKFDWKGLGLRGSTLLKTLLYTLEKNENEVIH